VTAVLRTMTQADLDQVVALELALFGEEAWSREMLLGELGQQPASRHYLVADDDGRIVGYAGLLGAGCQGDVLTLAVDADRWARGLAPRCLRHCSPKRSGAAASRSSWRCGRITFGLSSFTTGMTSPRSGSGRATTSHPALMPW
jgi:predicted N-acetyltransferase YhbS